MDRMREKDITLIGFKDSLKKKWVKKNKKFITTATKITKDTRIIINIKEFISDSQWERIQKQAKDFFGPAMVLLTEGDISIKVL